MISRSLLEFGRRNLHRDSQGCDRWIALSCAKDTKFAGIIILQQGSLPLDSGGHCASQAPRDAHSPSPARLHATPRASSSSTKRATVSFRRLNRASKRTRPSCSFLRPRPHPPSCAYVTDFVGCPNLAFYLRPPQLTLRRRWSPRSPSDFPLPSRWRQSRLQGRQAGSRRHLLYHCSAVLLGIPVRPGFSEKRLKLSISAF
jgi:hypothetical protein